MDRNAQVSGYFEGWHGLNGRVGTLAPGWHASEKQALTTWLNRHAIR